MKSEVVILNLEGFFNWGECVSMFKDPGEIKKKSHNFITLRNNFFVYKSFRVKYSFDYYDNWSVCALFLWGFKTIWIWKFIQFPNIR